VRSLVFGRASFFVGVDVIVRHIYLENDELKIADSIFLHSFLSTHV
jgi:hypothetical protein